MSLENQNTEWKETWRDEYIKRVCAFANAQGGGARLIPELLVYGVQMVNVHLQDARAFSRYNLRADFRKVKLFRSVR
jgi:hypothetical protein